MDSPKGGQVDPRVHNTALFSVESKTRDKPPPRILYKYTSLETAIAVMRSRRLRFQSPLNFNDPLDGQWNILWQVETPEHFQQMVRKMVSPGLDLGRILDPQMQQEIEKIRADHDACTTESQREQFIVDRAKRFEPGIVARPRLSKALKQIRVLCLSAIPDSLPMWAYYADHHRGAVLGFNTHSLEREWQVSVHPIRYLQALPPVMDPMQMMDVYVYGSEVPDSSDGEARVMAQTWSLSKADAWAHENEWRFGFISPNPDPHQYADVPFPKEALVEVAAGCQCDKQAITRLHYEAASKYPDAKFIEAKRHSQKFSLVGLRH
jgi:hypothetical protein